MKIKLLLNQTEKKLLTANIKSPHLEAELLLSATIKQPREFILAHPEAELTKKQASSFKLQVLKRTNGEPLAYITGHKEFYGLDFIVDKNVLIPRPETELMVEEALALITHNAQHTTIIDVGTGSGCIIITLAKQILAKYQIPDTRYNFCGIDILKPALAIAKQNAKLNGVDKNIKFLHGNLLEPILKNHKSKIINHKLLILANLPYLTPTQIKNSPGIKHEPKLALTAGPDGLKYYCQLFKQLKILNTKYNIPNTIYLLCEIDPSQKTKMVSLIKKELPQAKFKIKKDLKGHNRLVIIKI